MSMAISSCEMNTNRRRIAAMEIERLFNNVKQQTITPEQSNVTESVLEFRVKRLVKRSERGGYLFV